MNFVAVRTFGVEMLDSGIHEHYGGRPKRGHCGGTEVLI